MTAKRLYLLLWGAVGLSVVVLLLSIYLANSFLQHKAQTVIDARVKSMALDEKQHQLSKARADIAKYQSLADIAKSIVPQDKDQAQTVREIVSIAEANGIKLGTISFPTSSLGTKKGALSQLTKVKDIAGVYTLEVTVQSDTTAPPRYAQFIAFLDAMEHNPRPALVTGVSLVPEAGDPNKVSLTLNLNEYIKPCMSHSNH
jgi:hypothetical protein